MKNNKIYVQNVCRYRSCMKRVNLCEDEERSYDG